MNPEELLYDSSKVCILRATEAVFADTGLVDEMYRLALSEKPKVAQRALRVLNECAEHGPDLIEPYLKEIILKIKDIKNDSLRSNFLRIYTVMPIPEDEDTLGLLTQTCFDYLQEQFERAGVKVYSIEILYRISQLIPELKQELMITILQQKQYDSFAFQSRGERILKKLMKETGESDIELMFED